jgi:hypothetical protein
MPLSLCHEAGGSFEQLFYRPTFSIGAGLVGIGAAPAMRAVVCNGVWVG